MSRLVDFLWTGEPGSRFRKYPAGVRELALFFLVGPRTDIWGLFQVSLDDILGHTGRTEADTLKALIILEQVALVYYDIPSRWAFVPRLPETRFLAWPLLPTDKRVMGAKRWYCQVGENPFLSRWYDHHATDLFLTEPPAVRRREPHVDGTPVVLPEPPSDTEVDLFGERVKLMPERAVPTRHGLSPSELKIWFDRIVAIYPKKTELHRGRAALMELRPSPELMAEIWQALQWQVRQPDWLKENGHFAPNLRNYFKHERWRDKPALGPVIGESTARVMRGMTDFVMDFPLETERCVKPERKLRALPPPSAK